MWPAEESVCWAGIKSHARTNYRIQDGKLREGFRIQDERTVCVQGNVRREILTVDGLDSTITLCKRGLWSREAVGMFWWVLQWRGKSSPDELQSRNDRKSSTFHLLSWIQRWISHEFSIPLFSKGGVLVLEWASVSSSWKSTNGNC